MSPNILIIGAGPAGSAAAVFLAQAGFGATVVDRENVDAAGINVFKVGESLPPAAKILLDQLGIWASFQAAGHLKCYNNKSYWYSAQATFTDFITQPPGYGWHLDRVAFERQLVGRAREAGTRLLPNTKLKTAGFDGRVWTVTLELADGQTQAANYDFIIDASGRNSWLARRLGAERMIEDRQLALVTWLHTAKPMTEASSLIETTPTGWWYSANIPGDRMATAFLCKADKAQRALWQTPEGWQNLLGAAPHTERRIKEGEGTWLTPATFIAADSGILSQTCGPGWIAVGDAAMTYDPVASHGILMALVSARDAAKAIQAYCQGNTDAFQQYDEVMSEAYYAYVKERRKFYR
ncbi:MAG: 2-polyprenyl-6-methoxyphenol hydroxylase-like FAD-dependent oxidoreductase [Neolewinella sp.]|jgi:2-polyprenyl-6-methoxyphenol hydroxylase-like FAD-dependent oxidoreductase